MNCPDIDRALAQQSTLAPNALPADAGDHVRNCPRCRALLEVLSAPQPGDELRPELTHSIAQRIGQTLAAVRPLRPPGA